MPPSRKLPWFMATPKRQFVLEMLVFGMGAGFGEMWWQGISPWGWIAGEWAVYVAFQNALGAALAASKHYTESMVKQFLGNPEEADLAEATSATAGLDPSK